MRAGDRGPKVEGRINLTIAFLNNVKLYRSVFRNLSNIYNGAFFKSY